MLENRLAYFTSTQDSLNSNASFLGIIYIFIQYNATDKPIMICALPDMVEIGLDSNNKVEKYTFRLQVLLIKTRDESLNIFLKGPKKRSLGLRSSSRRYLSLCRVSF
jgi:hypothetical protein